ENGITTISTIDNFVGHDSCKFAYIDQQLIDISELNLSKTYISNDPLKSQQYPVETPMVFSVDGHYYAIGENSIIKSGKTMIKTSSHAVINNMFFAKNESEILYNGTPSCIDDILSI